MRDEEWGITTVIGLYDNISDTMVDDGSAFGDESESSERTDSSSISSTNQKQFDLRTVPENLPLDGSGDEHYIRRRSEYLRRVTRLRSPLPTALAYREIGYSSSGIAKKLDTRKTTVEKWMDEIAEEYGTRALETRPQSNPVTQLE